MGYRVAVVGATGVVGREMLSILDELKFPIDEIHAVASRKSMGVEVSYGDRILKCQDLEQFDFSKVDISTMYRLLTRTSTCSGRGRRVSDQDFRAE